MNTSQLQSIGNGAAAGRIGRQPAAAAASSSGSNQETPPLTNRGCVVPSGEPVFHLDYLKLTLFADLQAVLTMVESGLQEVAGLDLGGWLEKGPVERWASILVGD